MKGLFFAILFVVAASSLSGTWENELGSQMYIEIYQGLILDGWYNSTVGDALGTYPLVGFIGKATEISGTNKTSPRILCFSVLWQNGLRDSNSVTSWDGIFDGTSIKTVWVLRSFSGSHKNTTVGHDEFKKKINTP